MRASIALSIIALVIAACGTGSDRAATIKSSKQSASATAAQTTKTEPDSGNANVADALLALNDMPTGWSPSSDDSHDDSNPALCNQHTALDDIDSTSSWPSVTFEKGPTGPFFIEAIGKPNAGAQSTLTQLTSAVQTCSQWTEPDSGGDESTTWHLAALSFPKIGDETLAFRLTSDPTFIGAADVDFIFIRRGDYLIATGFVQIGFQGVDSEQVETLTRAADTKFTKDVLHR